MSELYLIAHKVHGKPAFDVATQIDCPECMDAGGCNYGCEECDQLGYWWIIPTSGHRAYPIMHWPVSDLVQYTGDGWQPTVETELGPIEANPAWASLPDHYAHKAIPTTDLATALGLRGAKPQPSFPFPRRQL